MARVVVADAGPLIAFAAIDRLSVLRALFSKLLIPESVQVECSAKPGPDTTRIDTAITDGWLQIEAVEAADGPLSPSLGQGESDSIRLAMQDPDNTLLILDDRLARRHALRKGLNIVGTVRLLHLAEQRRLIGDARQCVRDMEETGYRISLALLDRLRDSEPDL